VIKFEHLDIYNWHNANRGMRNSWESWDKIDSEYTLYDLGGREFREWVYGENDLKLAMKLVKAGSDHAKFLRQILVGVDIIAGNEFWKEFDTYKVGTTANSTSMMHKMGSRLLTRNDFSFDEGEDFDVDWVLEHLNDVIQQWWNEGKKIGTPTWRKMQKLVPMGFVYRRTVTMNYQVLRSMYHSRKAHRLAEWREFAKWVETLPYSEFITYAKGE
jgi:hypothetical protein